MHRPGTSTPNERAAPHTAQTSAARATDRAAPSVAFGAESRRRSSYSRPMDGIVSRPGDGEFLKGEDRALRVKLSRNELDVLEFEVGPDYEGPGPHFHKRHVDSFY